MELNSISNEEFQKSSEGWKKYRNNVYKVDVTIQMTNKDYGQIVYKVKNIIFIKFMNFYDHTGPIKNICFIG